MGILTFRFYEQLKSTNRTFKFISTRTKLLNEKQELVRGINTNPCWNKQKESQISNYLNYKGCHHKKSEKTSHLKLQWIIQITWYSNSWVQIVLFVFGPFVIFFSE